MSKPKLIICAGTGWSATRSLMFSLEGYNHGLCKEDHILYGLSLKSNKRKYDNFINDLMTIDREKTYRFTHQGQTVEKYIDLYLRNSVGHKGVTDFTNANQILNPFFLKRIRSRLHDAFDVKVVMIFRDPVRRLFSEVSAFYNNKWVEIDSTSCRDYFMKVLREGSATCSEKYTLYYNNWKNAGYNIHPIKMERIYSGDKRDLEKFLGHSIDLYPTAYYPERGVDAPLLEGMKCQKSDTETLSKEDYQYARGILNHEYQGFYNHI